MMTPPFAQPPYGETSRTALRDKGALYTQVVTKSFIFCNDYWAKKYVNGR